MTSTIASDHTDVSWYAHATGNYAPQSHGLHHSEYPQFDNPSSNPSLNDYPLKQSSLEETLKEFMQLISQSIIPVSQELSLEDTLEAFRKTVNQPFQEITDATVANTKAIARLEGQLGHLVAEFNILEEEELQSQEMARGQYMIDENDPSNSYHEHVQATSTPRNEEIVEEILCEPNIEDPELECFAQSNLDPDKFLKQVKTFNEPSLKDPLEEKFAQFEFDLDLDMIYELAKALLDPTLEMRTVNGETIEISFPNTSSLAAELLIVDNKEVEKEEHLEQVEHPPNTSNDKE